ncbi:hypothetical protein Tco_0776683 [Tanacetum coccineum]
MVAPRVRLVVLISTKSAFGWLFNSKGCVQIIMVNVIPPNHVDDVPVVELNQHDDVHVVPEPVLNEPELTYPYEEVDPLNPPPPAFASEPKDVTEAKNLIEHEDETVPASVHEVGESSTTPFLLEDSDGLLPGLMRRDINSLFGKAKYEYYGKLILDLGNEVRSSVDQGTTTMEKLVEKLGNAEDKVECKKLKMELEESRFSNIFLRMQNERIMPSKFDLWTQVAIRRMIKESVEAAIAAERARHVNAGNNARGSGPVKGQDVAPAVREWFEKTESVFGINECAESKKVKFAAATLQGPSLTWWNAKVATMGLETVNQMHWTEMKQLTTGVLSNRRSSKNGARTVELKERVKVDAYIQGLIDNIKGEVTSSKLANLNEAVRMAHKLMEQKLQARDERILKGKKITKSKGTRKPWLPLLLMEMCLMDHLLYVNDVLLAMLVCVLLSVTSVERLGIRKGHTRNLCPRKVKQEEVGEVHGQAYTIKDAELKGPNVACKYVERGCHLFLAHMTKNKSKEKQLEDVLIIHDFPEVFPEELPGLPPTRQVEFRLILVQGAPQLHCAPYSLATKQIHEAQEEEMKGENVKAEYLGRLIKQIFEFHPDGIR